MSSKQRRRLYEGFGVLEDNNSKTNIEQISNDSKSEPKTNIEQDVKQFSNNPKTENSLFSNNPNTQPKTVLETSLKQFSNNPKTIRGVASVVGLQRKILDYLFLKAQNSGSLNTGKIHTEILAEILTCSVETVRTSIQRLEKKSFIIRKEFKSGRGGFSVFELEKSAYQNLVFENNSKTNMKQNGNNSNTQPKTQPKTNDSNSSSISSLNNKETTTIEIPESLRSMISQKEISDLLGKGLIAEEDLAQSLEHFAYDVSNNLVKARSNPLSLFYGLTRSGKQYRSTTLIEIQNQELREYERSLEAVENENKRLKQLDLQAKFEEHKKKNTDYLSKVKQENRFIRDNDALAEKIAFSKFSESQEEATE